MLSLIKIEWLKLKKYPAFWWMMGIVALTYPGVNMMFHSIFSKMTGGKNMEGQLMKALIGNPFAFPEAWHSVGYLSSIFVMIPAILVIMIIANEYTYKTNRQNIIDGWTRDQFVLSKLFDVLIISVFVTVAFVLVALPFGFSYSSEIEQTRWAEQIKYIPLFLLQTFAQLSIAFLLGFVIKRSFIALGVFLFYFVIVEPIAVGYIRYQTSFKKLADFLPLEVSDKLIPPAAFIGRFNKEGYEQSLLDINMHIVYTCIFTAAIWWLCFLLYRKRDL
jgi:ABC-type transport system involved in multi-copper enzyme maturation permease subunit